MGSTGERDNTPKTQHGKLQDSYCSLTLPSFLLRNSLKLSSGWPASHIGQANPSLFMCQLKTKKRVNWDWDVLRLKKNKTAKTEAETHLSCSMKEGGSACDAKPNNVLRGGTFQGGEKDSSCRPITNYKNINKTLCALSYFFTLKSVLSSKNTSREIASSFFPPRSLVGNTKWPHIYVYRYIYLICFVLCLACVYIYIYIYIVSLTQ